MMGNHGLGHYSLASAIILPLQNLDRFHQRADKQHRLHFVGDVTLQLLVRIHEGFLQSGTKPAKMPRIGGVHDLTLQF